VKMVTRRAATIVAGLSLAVGLAAGATGAVLTGKPVSPADRGAIEAIVRDYILTHPEILPEAMERLHDKELLSIINTNRKTLETPFAGAWAGAKDGDVVLVEFTDYACGFCRRTVPDIERLLAEDKKLKVVWRELPIIGPSSEPAARIALAAAKRGTYTKVHQTLFAGQLTDAKIATAAQAAGVTAADGRTPDIEAELGSNMALAQALRVNGTPAFVIGDRMLSGALGYDALKAAVAEARAR